MLTLINKDNKMHKYLHKRPLVLYLIHDRGLPQTITRATRKIRRRAVSMVQKGTPSQEVADLLGVAARSIFYWLARYRSGGWDGLQTACAAVVLKLGEADMRWITRQ